MATRIEGTGRWSAECGQFSTAPSPSSRYSTDLCFSSVFLNFAPHRLPESAPDSASAYNRGSIKCGKARLSKNNSFLLFSHILESVALLRSAIRSLFTDFLYNFRPLLILELVCGATIGAEICYRFW